VVVMMTSMKNRFGLLHVNNDSSSRKWTSIHVSCVLRYVYTY